MIGEIIGAGSSARMVTAAIGLAKILLLFGGAAWAINDYQAGVYSRAEQRWDAEADRERLGLANARLAVADEVRATNKRLKAKLLNAAATPVPPSDGQLCRPGCIVPSSLTDGEAVPDE